MQSPIKEDYQYITFYDALKYSKGRQGQKINYIVIHHWGKRGQTFEGVLDWFCKNKACETSAHYVAEAGRVACIVDLKDTAYHAGDWLYNLQSIGIECRPEATEGDYQTVAQLIAKLWRAYGKLELVAHRNVPNVYTACPGVWDMTKLRKLAEVYYNGKEVKPVEKVKITEPSEWAKPFWQKFKAMGFFDGTRPKEMATREEVITINAKAYESLKTDIELLKKEVYKKEGK